MTPTTSAFALPDRLAAKADPGLIADDERHFAAIADCVERTVAELTAQLATARRARGDSSGELLERDQEVRRLSTRLRALGLYGLDLCLGRMTPADGSAPIYIGRLGLTDATGQRLLVDWRSPRAEPFFGATHGDPMGLAARRRYRWTLGRIGDYWDEVFTPDVLDADAAGSAALDDQSAFIASLGSSRSPRMRDVLGTIQADQDRIIRAGSRGALVVDGGPGTGKTVVALHRAAYLLYSDPRLGGGGGRNAGGGNAGSGNAGGGRHGGVLFVGPSRGYLSYVSDILPNLGEDGVRLCELRDLTPEGADAPAEPDAEVARLKSDARLLDAVEAAVAHYERPPTETLTVSTDWADLELDAAAWEEAFGAAEPGMAHDDAREAVWEAIVEVLADQLGEEAPPHLVRRALQRDEELRAAVARAWPLLDPAGVVADLWSVPAYLRACAPWLSDRDIRLLQRAEPRAWTVADLPFLDAARQRIGDPEAARLARRRSGVLAAQRERMAEVIDDLIQSEELGDGDGVMKMLRQDTMKEFLVDESAAEALPPDRLAGPFAHIVVDEAQELTDAEWQMLLRRCPSRSFTIVGDRAQARHGFRESWEERLRRIGIDRVELSSLTVNYRTPEEVMRLAEPVIRAALPDANVPTSIRASGLPVRSAALAELRPLLDGWLAANGDGIAAVLSRRPLAAGAVPEDPRIRVLAPELSKGLEFDLVVLVEPETFGDGVEGAVDRYVAMTRSTRELVLLEG